jgi:hypothetical protein
MWAVVSIIWSLIIAAVVAAFWSLGEYLYQPQAGYHLSAWSLGVGALVFVWLLYISYKARHRKLG